MSIKLPWIKSRRRLFVLTSTDIVIFLFFYFYFLKVLNISNSPILSLLIISPLIFINYILGRYSSLEEFKTVKKISLLSLINFFLVSIFYCSLLYLFNLPKNNINLYYLLESFLLAQQVLSQLIHFATRKYIFKNSLFVRKWLVIGSQIQYKELIEEVIISSFKFDISLANIDQLSRLKFSKNKSNFGFIILEPEKLTKMEEDYLDLICRYNNPVLDVLLWSELYLQRFPICFLTSNQKIFKKFFNFSNNIQYRIKRTFDVIVSLIIIVLTLPIVLLCSILIILEDKGPVLYSQTRTGLNNKNFKIYKLRTMKVNSEINGVQWSKKNDNRITFVGNFLRRTRIDELPQLFCVLKSDMSLIGPRPERPEIDNLLRSKIQNYDLRYKIKPGLSGWSQVNYPYGASIEDSKNKLSYDLYYIKNFNIFLDLLIFLKTIRLVLNASGSIAK